MSTKKKDAVKTDQLAATQQHNETRSQEVTSSDQNVIHNGPTSTISEANPVTGKDQIVPIDPRLIRPSPFQHRTVFDPTAMEELLKDIRRNGIHTPLIVRSHPSIDNEFELVTGECRLRTAVSLNLEKVPAFIRPLNDREVKELQWSENFRRTNPNSLDEACSLNQMLEYHKTVDGLARYFGKSKAYVLTRLQLINLIPPIREMVHASVFNLKESLDISNLAPDAQQSFFNDHCHRWQDKQSFRVVNLSTALNKFRCDLFRAVFDTRDKDLVPEAGACNRCKFNSSTFHSLFPESEKSAICNRLECFENKCKVHLRALLTEMIRTHQPQALVFTGHITETWQALLDEFPETAAWPRFSYHDITTAWAPTPPEKEDFFDDDDFDEDGYNEAMKEFEEEFVEYQHSLTNKDTQKGLWLQNSSIECMLFHAERKKDGSFAGTAPVTAAAVKHAIKAGTATPELLQAETDRIRQREKRQLELDQEKIQKAVHDQLAIRFKNDESIPASTRQDQLAVRLLIYQSLNYSGKDLLHQHVPFEEEKEDGTCTLLTDWLAQLDETQVAFMARLATYYKSEALSPTSDTGRSLVLIAEGIGIDVAGIRADQQKLADTRTAKANDRIASLQSRINELESKKAA